MFLTIFRLRLTLKEKGQSLMKNDCPVRGETQLFTRWSCDQQLRRKCKQESTFAHIKIG